METSITNVKLSLLVLIFFLTGCAGGGGVSRSQCKFQEYCDRHIGTWQKAIDAVTQANFPDEKFKGIVHYKDFKNAWVTTGENINITALLLDKLNFNQMVAVAAHEIAHLKSSSSNHPEVDQIGIDYLIKAGMHAKDFLTLLYWMQEYCMDNHDRSCSTYDKYSERIEQIENSMSAADWRLALPDLVRLLKVDEQLTKKP
jgi:hypothetical protein